MSYLCWASWSYWVSLIPLHLKGSIPGCPHGLVVPGQLCWPRTSSLLTHALEIEFFILSPPSVDQRLLAALSLGLAHRGSFLFSAPQRIYSWGPNCPECSCLLGPLSQLAATLPLLPSLARRGPQTLSSSQDFAFFQFLLSYSPFF